MHAWAGVTHMPAPLMLKWIKPMSRASTNVLMAQSTETKLSNEPMMIVDVKLGDPDPYSVTPTRGRR